MAVLCRLAAAGWITVHNSNISDERLQRSGLDPAAIDFLSAQRVELNAMTSRQFINFVEAKL